MKKHNYLYRIVSFVLLVVIMVSSLSFNVFAADPTVKVSSVSGNPGETVDVTVSLENNPGIVSMTLKINYDSKLTLVKVNDTGMLPGSVHKPTLSNPYTLTWVNDTATKNYKVNGTLVTLSFKIDSSAVKGKTYNVGVSYNYNNYDIYDVNLNRIKFNTINGGVTVNSSITTGKIRKVSLEDYNLNYKDSIIVYPEIEADAGTQYTVSYSSSDTSVVSIDSNGKMTSCGTGNAVITCSVKDANGNTIEANSNASVKYTWWQWIIVILLFGWIWY